MKQFVVKGIGVWGFKPVYIIYPDSGVYNDRSLVHQGYLPIVIFHGIFLLRFVCFAMQRAAERLQ